MKPFHFFLLLAIFPLLPNCAAHAQENEPGEFGQYNNGLIYSDSAMGRLRFMVDSLNIRFRKCDPWKTYYSYEQSIGHYVYIEDGAKKAKKDIENGISLEDLRYRYPQATIEENLLLIRHKTQTWEGEDKAEVFAMDFQSYSSASFLQPPSWLNDHENTNEWVYVASGDDLYAFLILQDFRARAIPEPYSRLIQYSDCLIDTSVTIYNTNAREAHRGFTEPMLMTSALLKYIARLTSEPQEDDYKEDDFLKYFHDHHIWDSVHYFTLDEEWARGGQFKSLLTAAHEEAVRSNSSHHRLEAYVTRYLSKADALSLKRNRIVVGGCSMDESPRIHALEIATLSAESFNWEIFLRAHLDIMNDNFSRVSDGSYAWAARKTYIAELEHLNIDVPALMLGISLRISNPSGHHYYGDIGRLGRALSESKYSRELEQQMVAAIKDSTLDAFNRGVIFNLFRSYVAYLDDTTRKQEGRALLEESLTYLPDYLSKRIKLDEE